MDRISFTQHASPAANQAVVREPKLIDDSARLRFADRADTVELSSQAQRQAQASSPAPAQSPAQCPPRSMARLVAARVTEPAHEPSPSPASPKASRAMRFYADPSDQNAAATLGAGSALDILA